MLNTHAPAAGYLFTTAAPAWQPHHCPVLIFGWKDSYAVLAAALVVFFIPSLCVLVSHKRLFERSHNGAGRTVLSQI